MARRVEQVEHAAVVLERHHRGDDRDAALALDRHPVRAGRAAVALGLDLAGELDRAAEQQQLLGQRGLAGVGVGDDREGAAPLDLAGERRGRAGSPSGGRVEIFMTRRMWQFRTAGSRRSARRFVLLTRALARCRPRGRAGGGSGLCFMTLGTDYILSALADEGLGHLFMVPGGLVDPFLPALARQTQLKPVVAAHEGGAVYMADGYARASGSFGAALGIGGPGCCNMATAVAAAQHRWLAAAGDDRRGAGRHGRPRRIPGRQPGDARRHRRHGAARRACPRRSPSSRNLNHWFRHALTTMWAQPRGPVHLSLTHDALTGECAADYVKVGGFFAGVRPLSMAAGGAGARCCSPIRERGEIAILAGAGVEHDAAAARLQAHRRTLVDSGRHHAARQGRVPGGSRPVARRLRLCRHAPRDRRGPRRRSRLPASCSARASTSATPCTGRCASASKALMIHVNTDMDELTAQRRSGPCRAGKLPCLPRPDARTRRPHRARAGGRRRRSRRDGWRKIKSGPRLYDVENCSRPAAPIHPATAIAALRKVFPRDGIVLVDSGAHRAFAGHYWSAYEPRTYISATNLGPMGWAIPAAVGVQCARPGPARRGDHRRRLHADARHRGADRGALRTADHLRRAQQRRARQCLAARAPVWRPAGRTDQHPGS